jgi:hypothetical protein
MHRPLAVLPTQVDDVVVALDESLRATANSVTMRLRRAGRSVDLVLEQKKMKWALKVSSVSGASGFEMVMYRSFNGRLRGGRPRRGPRLHGRDGRRSQTVRYGIWDGERTKSNANLQAHGAA